MAALSRPRYYNGKVKNMKDYRDVLVCILNKLEEHYQEYGNGKDMTYTYGFFDAVAVVRNMTEAPPSDMKRYEAMVG